MIPINKVIYGKIGSFPLCMFKKFCMLNKPTAVKADGIIVPMQHADTKAISITFI